MRQTLAASSTLQRDSSCLETWEEATKVLQLPPRAVVWKVREHYRRDICGGWPIWLPCQGALHYLRYLLSTSPPNVETISTSLPQRGVQQGQSITYCTHVELNLSQRRARAHVKLIQFCLTSHPSMECNGDDLHGSVVL
eukprot:1401275-Amphidinium_carterae.1